MDSACTDHLVNDDRYFFEYIELKNPVNAKLPNGEILQATKVGKINITVKSYYNKINIQLNNIFYVKNIKRNLLSVSKKNNFS